MLALIEGIPEDSAFFTSVRGADWAGWTRTESLLADIYDAVNVNTTATGRWKKRPPKIQPYPRPKSRRRKVTTVADLKRKYMPKPGG